LKEELGIVKNDWDGFKKALEAVVIALEELNIASKEPDDFMSNQTDTMRQALREQQEAHKNEVGLKADLTDLKKELSIEKKDRDKFKKDLIIVSEESDELKRKLASEKQKREELERKLSSDRYKS